MRIQNKKIAVVGLALLLLSGVICAMFFRMYASDCTSVEKYDFVSGGCYYECDTDQDCSSKAAKVDAELNAYFADATSKISKQDHGQQSAQKPTTSQSDNTRSITKDFTGSDTNGTIYTVNTDLSLRPKPTSNDQMLWNLFVRVAGKQDIARYIQSFEVFKDANNDSAASVWSSQTPGKWHVNVNAAYQNDTKDLIHTMVHEYGHIVSLNNTQVPQVSGSCPRLVLPEGCAAGNSYIQAFYNKFWQKYGDDAPSDMGSNDNEVASFYEEHTSSFVTDYAATNYGEDWAESWAAFVTGSKPNGSQEKDAKVRYFYSYPELVSNRDRIRLQIADFNAQSK